MCGIGSCVRVHARSQWVSKYIVIVLLFIIAIVIWIYPQILIKASAESLMKS